MSYSISAIMHKSIIGTNKQFILVKFYFICYNETYIMNFRGATMDFIAIDFETATSQRTSVCSLGICEVKNNKVIKRDSMLIRPEPLEFNPYNIKIHGITPDMVADMPNFAMLWNYIKPMIDGKLVIAHNASFDINVLCKTLDSFDIEYPTFDYLCTVKLSQKAYPELISHKLNALAEEFGICFSHHDACDDAYVCALVLLHIMKDYKLQNLDDIKRVFDTEPGNIFPGCKCTEKEKKKKVKNVK